MTIAKQETELLPEFTMDHLGTSFKVILVNSVREIKSGDSDKEIFIPDESGLHKVISWHRALDERKLSGGDIRYLRKNLGMKAKDLAAALDISPEYLSRCESGEKVMASNVEKMLRLTVLLEVFYVLEKAGEGKNISFMHQRLMDHMSKIRHLVLNMKVVSVADASAVPVYHFTRKLREKGSVSKGRDAANDADGEWLEAA